MIIQHIDRFTWRTRCWRSTTELERLFTLGGRLERLDGEVAKRLRRGLLSCDDSDFKRVLRLLQSEGRCSKEAFEALTASPRMRERMLATGLIRLPRNPADVSPQHYRVPKDELQRLVWQEPTQVIAKRLGVSDVAISKWCRGYGIDKPPRGYWARVKAGRVRRGRRSGRTPERPDPTRMAVGGPGESTAAPDPGRV